VPDGELRHDLRVALAVHRRNPSEAESRVILTATRAVDAVVSRLRGRLGGGLNQFHLALRRVEVQHDPETAAWIAQIRSAVADGSIAKRLDAQQAPKSIVDEYRSQLV